MYMSFNSLPDGLGKTQKECPLHEVPCLSPRKRTCAMVDSQAKLMAFVMKHGFYLKGCLRDKLYSFRLRYLADIYSKVNK